MDGKRARSGDGAPAQTLKRKRAVASSAAAGEEAAPGPAKRGKPAKTAPAEPVAAAGEAKGAAKARKTAGGTVSEGPKPTKRAPKDVQPEEAPKAKAKAAKAKKQQDVEPAKEPDAIALDPEDEEKLQKRIKSLGSSASTTPGVIYLGRIPHGFYEEQMKEYFAQFGEITHIRLSRNKKTGRSKHYAFLEFKSAEVAKIVAETMDNYLLFGHLLKCHVVEPSKVHPELWKGADRKFSKIPWQKLQRERHNKPRDAEQQEKLVGRLLQKEEEKRRQLAEALGEEFDFGGYAAEVAKLGASKPAKAIKK